MASETNRPPAHAPGEVQVIDRINVPLGVTQVIRAGSQLWVRGGRSQVSRVGSPQRLLRGRVLATGMAKVDGKVWVSLGYGRGATYGVLSTGPGFPREHALIQLSGVPRRQVRVFGPVDVVSWQGRLWVLTWRYTPRRAVLVSVDPATGTIEESFRVPREAERLVVAGSTLWLASGLSDRLWPVHVRRDAVGRPISLRLNFGGLLIAADRRRIAVMNTGSRPRLLVVNVRTRELVRIPFGDSYPHGLAIREGQLWVAYEPAHLQVFSLCTGRPVAAGRVGGINPESVNGHIAGLFDVGRNVTGTIVGRQLVLLSAERTRDASEAATCGVHD